MDWTFKVDDFALFFFCGSGYGAPSLAATNAHSTVELYAQASYKSYMWLHSKALCC